MIEISEDNSAECEAAILSGLKAFNRTRCEWLHAHPDAQRSGHNFIARDSSGALLGGAVGYEQYGWFSIDLLLVTEAARGHGLGSRLMAAAERHARQAGCVGVRVGTWSFQALDFYKKCGFTVYGSLSDFPPGATAYLLKKKF